MASVIANITAISSFPHSPAIPILVPIGNHELTVDKSREVVGSTLHSSAGLVTRAIEVHLACVVLVMKGEGIE